MAWIDLTRATRIALALALAAGGAACANSNKVQDTTGNGGADTTSGGGDGDEACLLHNCNSDAECGGCSDGRTTCIVEEHRCVACDAESGTGCAEGEYCSSFGACVPTGVSCPTDTHGTPTITCASSADCVACDPMHQVCDSAQGLCVACTGDDTSACQSTDLCIDDTCSAKCPASCATDNDCASCGALGNEAHACNAHMCSQCSATYACPAGETCSPEGVCDAKCGQDGAGACSSDADCAGCGGDATACHKALNGPGKCGPAAAGCSDLGQGVAVLPEPWSEITNLCSNDGDCAGVGIQLNVGKMLRDLTGFDSIGDADLDYGMNVCASVTVGSDQNSLSCGVCVPCRVDADCKDVDIDQVAGQAFGAIGSVAAAILLDQIFGPNDHKVHMYCESVAGDYGICSPCPGLLYACGVGGDDPGSGSGSGSGGGGANCHDDCQTGAPMDTTCDACSSALCAVDAYCCATAWDDQCVGEVAQYCGNSCDGGGSSGSGGGGGCAHEECSAGPALDPSCSSCAGAVCAADDYCCTNEWDDQCVSEVDAYCPSGC